MEVEGLKLSWTLWGPPGHKSVSVCPIFIHWRKRAKKLLKPSTSSKGHIQTVADWGREGRGGAGGDTAAARAWCWFPPQVMGPSSLCIGVLRELGPSQSRRRRSLAGKAAASGPTLIGKADDWDGWRFLTLLSSPPASQKKFTTLQPLPPDFTY